METVKTASFEYLIDMAKKKPEAVAKLLKVSEIDPLDLDLDRESETKYVPGSHIPSEADNDFYSTIEELKSSDSFNLFLDDVVKKWDERSITVLRSTPMLIRVLNQHIESGVYDIIMDAIQRERIFGRLDGLTDLDSYKAVGDALQEKGAFKHLAAKANPSKQREQRQVDPKIKRRKQAAASTKGSSRASPKSDFNPLSMSDEEFEKSMEGSLI